MDSSAHDVVLRNHVAIRSIIILQMICWADDIHAVACAHPAPIVLAVRRCLQHKGRLPRLTASRSPRRAMSRLPRRTRGSL
eukprot:3288342-Pyramimonas_sp.AAC.1